ncbi:hypothetical protein BPOR_1278g00020 [Botrytis porri]|uniref:Uncharacterized protein n=1 Tax=Botrytis porri TaxID=87229 RepID=A0A4Z1KJ40_9HELO|nr:hypothetical protein BPOR_1278g00020 [Botrytis porri]
MASCSTLWTRLSDCALGSDGVCTRKPHKTTVAAPKAAPRNGQMIAANPNAAHMIPKYAARWASGITLVVINTLPEKTPAAPSPAIARPTIRVRRNVLLCKSEIQSRR